MKTAIITCIDDKLLLNFQKDFLQTLRKKANYNGKVYVLYYGKNESFVRNLEKKYDIEIIFLKNKRIVSNQRNIDIINLIKILPKEISHILCIDGGDIWFQKPIEDIFKLTRSGYGFVEETQNSDEKFNLSCINQITNEDLRIKFLEKSMGRKLINGGFLIGKKEIIFKILKLVVEFSNKINQDFFALDQTILNYVIRCDGNGLKLPKKYCFTLLSDRNRFFVKNGLIYEMFTEELINIIHNIGGNWRIFSDGRESIVPKKLPGSFWGLTTYFNPAKYNNKIENYRKFRECSKKQGLKLLCVELAFNDDRFELDEKDADILIQVRSKSIMWQKERLLNIGLKNLPKNCDKIAWLDCDIIFQNDNWIEETSKLLEEYKIVQPFSFVIKSPKYFSNFNIHDLNFGFDDGEISHGFAYGVKHFGEPVLNSQVYNYIGNIGYAWSARKEFIETHGFYDKSVMGANDVILAYAFYGKMFNQLMDIYPKKLLDDIKIYSDKISSFVKSNVGYTKGVIVHIWHGSIKHRGYGIREFFFSKHNFDPKNDLKLNKDGCYEWNSKKIKMHIEAKNYFFARNEDDYLVKT